MATKRKRPQLALIAAGVGGAAVAGFGFAFGRDIYAKTKRYLIIILLLFVAFVGPFLGGRWLFRGYDGGIAARTILTFAASLFLIAAGFVVMSILSHYGLALCGFTQIKLSPEIALLPGILLGAAFTLVLTAAGAIVGLRQRPGRLLAFSVRRENEKFLKENRFVETDGEDITHYDRDGQPLRYLEVHPGKIAFMAVGRRGKRAFIELDTQGRMVSYTGVV